MNSIQKEQILRVNCPGFGEENYFTVGKAKSLDAYKVIIVNPISIFHLFDNDLKLQKEIDNDLADGLTSRTVASDALLQSIQEELKTRRILELVSFLEKGGLLIYYLCRPFLVQGDNVAIDNYAWLESLAPDSSPDDNIRHMSAVSHGRVVETTADGEGSEFAPYLAQSGLEWNTIIRQDFLTDGYKPLATAGPRKCISAQLIAGDQGGRILFLPAPYSPDFDKKLIECVQAWNVTTNRALGIETSEVETGAIITPAPALATVSAVESAPIITPPPPAVVVESAPIITPPPPAVVVESAPIITPPPPAVVVENVPIITPPPPAVVVESAPIITPPPPAVIVESAITLTPPPPVTVVESAPLDVPTPVLAAVEPSPTIVETSSAADTISISDLEVLPPGDGVSLNAPTAVSPEVPSNVSVAPTAQNLVDQLELLSKANQNSSPQAAVASENLTVTVPSEPIQASVPKPAVAVNIGKGLFGDDDDDDDDDDKLSIAAPVFASAVSPIVQGASAGEVLKVDDAQPIANASETQITAPPTASISLASLGDLIDAAATKIENVVAENQVLEQVVVPSESPAVIAPPQSISVPAAEALIPAIDETQELKAPHLRAGEVFPGESLILGSIVPAKSEVATNLAVEPVIEITTGEDLGQVLATPTVSSEQTFDLDEMEAAAKSIAQTELPSPTVLTAEPPAQAKGAVVAAKTEPAAVVEPVAEPIATIEASVADVAVKAVSENLKTLDTLAITETTETINGATEIKAISLPESSPLASLPLEVLPMPKEQTAAASNEIKSNGNGHHSNGSGDHKTEGEKLSNILEITAEHAAQGAEVKAPEAKDLIKKMEEISKNTTADTGFEFNLPQSDELRKRKQTLLDSIKQAQVEVANVDNKIAQLEHLKDTLLRGEGDELIAACQRILTKLGWTAQPSEKSEQEVYLLAADKPQALTRIVRSSSQAKRTDIAELGESVFSFWGEHEIEVKGVMLACTWADRNLIERQEQDYTDGLAQFAQKKGLCLMTTVQLLCMYRDVELGRITSDEARTRIIETNGRLAGFQVELPLVTA